MCRAPHLTHPPTQRAVRLPEGTRLEGPGRTWKDRTRQEERRPSTPWLVGRAPNFGTFSAYERFATVAFFLLGWEWLASRLAAVPGTRPRSQRSG